MMNLYEYVQDKKDEKKTQSNVDTFFSDKGKKRSFVPSSKGFLELGWTR